MCFSFARLLALFCSEITTFGVLFDRILPVGRFVRAKLNRVGTIGIDSHSFEYSDRFALKNCIRKPETENLSLHSVEMEINLTKKHWAKRLYDCPLNESPLTMVYNNCMIRIQPCRAAHRRHHHHHRDDVNSRGQTSSNCSFRTHTHTVYSVPFRSARAFLMEWMKGARACLRKWKSTCAHIKLLFHSFWLWCTNNTHHIHYDDGSTSCVFFSTSHLHSIPRGKVALEGIE